MHFEVPKLPTRGFKDFAKHYLMIVLSILTALGLEAWIEHAHHAHAAELASHQIKAELRANLDGVRNSYQSNQQRLVSLQQLDDAIAKDIRDGKPDAAINQHIQALKNEFNLSLDWPIFANQAWDVAVANQSATWMDRAALSEYSAVYSKQRDAASWMTQDSTLFLDAPKMATLRTRIDLGREVDPIEFLSVLRQMIITSSETQSQLKQVESQLKQVPTDESGRNKS
ncbi:hypothetical protein EAH75_11730 [Rhodanobacter glycinis]|uniref:Uncharacterized protein n=1 Tax=Rhodanobacter glycinis TaxID=582702 RepID=A0A502FDL2_9GAMM|nr:hypothetical protein [Rhodanobacter glycinis]TPG11638.1 hypothetical protein EAH88_03805 [Rhodanobacter glycinis]TPG47510.1 hypothetical protein EAH75_11730 [Rhodanobacter glycinis]